MFCIHCGHELDSNNICHNNLCPSKMNSNSQSQNYNYANSFNTNSSFNQMGQNYYNRFNCDPNFVDKNGISLSEMTAYIGNSNTSFYIDKWANNHNNLNFISWNWPAFFSSWIWLFYRKLNLFGAVYFAINLLSLIFLPVYVFSLVLFASNISCALLGNQIYIKHCIKKIKLIKNLPLNMDINTYYSRLRYSGGTSVIALIIGIIISIISSIFITANYVSDNYKYRNSYKSYFNDPYSSDPFSDYDDSGSGDSFFDDFFDNDSDSNNSLPDNPNSNIPGLNDSKSGNKNL